MSVFKKANDIKTLSINYQDTLIQLDDIEQNKLKGLGCGELLESVPHFNKSPSEKVFQGDNNTWIVLGRDRSGPKFVSGEFDNGENLGPYGPKGHMKCGTIDIVAGRFSSFEFDNNGKIKVVDPDFFHDASRIYISQRTDLDHNFKIGSEENRDKNANRAGIGIKSDNLRFIARESIKLVTGTDRKNSLGGDVLEVQGIELIAGNDDTDVQPFLKGENSIELLKKMMKHISAMNGIVDAFVEYQLNFNKAISNHTHISPFFGSPTTPSEVLMIEGGRNLMNMLKDVKRSLYGNKINLSNVKQNYLEPYGDGYVASRYNGTN